MALLKQEDADYLVKTTYKLEIMEDFVKKHGFDSLKEFYHLVANSDLSSKDKIISFKKWQYEDGSKEGLLKLHKNEKTNNTPLGGAGWL